MKSKGFSWERTIASRAARASHAAPATLPITHHDDTLSADDNIPYKVIYAPISGKDHLFPTNNDKLEPKIGARRLLERCPEAYKTKNAVQGS